MRYIRSLFVLLFLAGVMSLRAQQSTGPADCFSTVRVSLVICSPGEQVYSLLGHAALRVENTARQTDLIYSYEGIISTSPLWDYMRGKVRSQWREELTDTFISRYAAENRTVKCYPLQMPDRYLQRIQDTLSSLCMVKTEKYECVRKGCAVSILHLVEKVLAPGHIEYGDWDERFDRTRRQLITDAVLEESNWWDWLIANCLLPGSAAEACRKEDKLCIPTDLLEAWQKATFDGTPLIRKE